MLCLVPSRGQFGFNSNDFDLATNKGDIPLSPVSILFTLEHPTHEHGLHYFLPALGAFTVICESKEVAAKLKSQLKIIIRTMYSNPPKNGAQIASTILNDPVALTAWKASTDPHRLPAVWLLSLHRNCPPRPII